MATKEDLFLSFLRTLPDASGVRSRVPLRPRDVVQSRPTIGAAPAGSAFTPNLTPRGHAQELNPQRGISAGDVLDATVPVRPAAKLGYSAAERLAQGDKSGAAVASLAALPMMMPGATFDRLLGRGAAKLAFNKVEPEAFHAALSTFAKERPSEAGFITWRTPEEMRAEGMNTYLSPDQKTGYAIHPASGDIRNVFNHGAQGGGAKAVADAVANNGGKVLDAFDTNLGNFYRDMGFKETWRSPWDEQYRPANWDTQKYGTPDVIGMEHPQAGQTSADDLLSNYEQSRNARKSAATPTQLQPEQLQQWRGITDYLRNQNANAKSASQASKTLSSDLFRQPPPGLHDPYVRPGLEDMAIPGSNATPDFQSAVQAYNAGRGTPQSTTLPFDTQKPPQY